MKISCILFLLVPVLSQQVTALTPVQDKFPGSFNNSRWSMESGGKGTLRQAGGRIHFTTASPPTEDDYSILTLRNNRPGYNENWQVILDVSNTAGTGSDTGLGIMIANAADAKDSVNLEFYGSGNRGGFNFIGITDDKDDPSKDVWVNPGVTNGSMKISFSKNTKLFTFWYDQTGSADGFQWTKLTSFSPAATGGGLSGNWKMNRRSGSFTISLYGYSEKQLVPNGKVSFDNFVLKAAK